MSVTRIAYGFIPFLILSCSDTQFSGGLAKFEEEKNERSESLDVEAEAETEEEEEVAANSDELTTDEKGSLSLTWNFSCPSSNQNSDDEKDVSLAGEDLTLNISTELCNLDQFDRDIVMVIDGSVSMNINDPVAGTTCGRYQALDRILSSFTKPELIRIALVIFDDTILESSLNFVDVASFRNTYLDYTRVCRAELLTSYTTALAETIAIMNQARAHAYREVYFISDGEPSPASHDGIKEAKMLKNNSHKATIATIMLEGDDKALKRLASKNLKGEYLHAKVEKADQLADQLSNLASTRYGGGNFYYRGFGEETWKTTSISPSGDDGKIKVNLTGLNQEKYPDGIEFYYEYWDDRGKRISDDGRLNFKN